MPGSLEDWAIGALVVVGVILLIGGLALTFRPKATPGDPTAVEAMKVNLNLPPPSVLLFLGAALLVAAAYLGLQSPAHTTASPAPPSTGPASVTPGVTAGLPFASLTYPPEGTTVGQAKGFTAGGTVNDPGPYTVWILDHPSYGYVVDVKATVQGTGWAASDLPLGNQSDALPYRLTVVAVLADPGCARALNAVSGNTAANRMQTLPSGCSQFGQVTVDVTQR